jgi:hypothetical protein
MSTSDNTSTSQRDVYRKVTDAIIITAASKAQQACDWLIVRAGESARVAEVAA